MKNYIRILTIIAALMFGAVGGAWAQLITNDEIEVKPNASAGTVTIADVTTRVVTLTVTPASGYYIKASDIIVEKLVDPEKANAPKQRVGEITDVIKGKMYNSDMTKEISSVEAGSTAKYIFTVPDDYDGAYVTATFTSLAAGEIIITSSTSSVTYSADGHYILVDDIDASVLTNLYVDTPFRGTFDGNGYTISGLTQPLFKKVNGGVVKNVMLKNVHINQSGNVGAITGEARGYTRIYNCGILPSDNTFSNRVRHSSVASTNAYCGGLVGFLADNSRVINCFSYANINGGTYVAGIVGYNDIASTAEVSDEKYANLKTAVVNCMFYGNITSGTYLYPVYGGRLINNATATGISSYNYYSNNSTFNTSNGRPTNYNCSFPADVRYLTQVEFHRSLLNSNRELCGWWVASDVAPSTLTTAEVQAIPKDASLMYKWVVDPSVAPYPILKPFGKYASVVNGNTGTPWVDRATANPYEGKQLGTLIVTVNSGSHSSVANRTLSIPITDMDTLHYDFGYRKIQLPYYNTVFGNPEGSSWEEKYANNYTAHVVTGWKITAVSGGTKGEFVADWESGYNFADRKCTDKDIYDVSGRVFAQGGNYYVPDGVTSITIEAYWGKAIYVRNDGGYYDRVNITLGNTGSAFAPAGTRSNNVNGATIQSTTKLSDALTGTNIDAKKTVYDYALVLVGNVQESVGKNDFLNPDGHTRGFTMMSVDLDFDEEPDYCLEWQLGEKMGRQVIAPIRFDFLPVVELGIAGKRHNSTNFFSLGCYRSKGHFEVTETSFIRFGQFEFELGSRDVGPVILNGGIYDQYCRGRNGETTQNINYVILGGHVVMPSFTPGAHVNNAALYKTRHCAVNVLGGDFTSFYLTGGYNEAIVPYEDNPHCYIDGGRFGTIAAAYKEGIWGNVTWRINHALIREFYGGGVMSQKDGSTYKIVKGNIDVVIDNSIVGKYCGGPKFGDMVSGKTVTTRATGTIFNQYFGAGNGGTNYVQYTSTDATGTPITNWSSTINTNYTPEKYRSKDQGYEADYDIEIINTSTGDQNSYVVNRSYYYSAQFATTNTGNVTNILNNCTINTNFYGGGFLGGVTGDVTSTLNNCTVAGSVFGAGYSADAGTVTIHNIDKVAPVVNTSTGMIKPQTGGTSTTYYWTNDKGSTDSPITVATETDPKDYFYTEIPLDNLGTVTGNVTLNINGTTTVGKSVYGGGEESDVSGNTHVTMTDGYVFNGIFGGGLAGSIGTITARTPQNYDGTAHDTSHPGCIGGKPTAFKDGTGKCTVVVTGGQIGPIEVATKGMTRPASEGGPVPEGWVWGGGCGIVKDPLDDPDTDFRTYVGSTDVTIGGDAFILESIIGGGEFGRVLGDTHVTIEGNCQIGVGKNQVDGDKPKRYADDKFIDPTTTTITNSNALPECSHFEYGHDYDGDGKPEYLTFDPYYDKYYDTTSGSHKENIPENLKLGSTSHACDGKTWIGCVFGGGSGYMPYEKKDGSGYGWIRSAGLVEGNTLVEIKGGHILTNVYGANEVTDVKGTSTVRMSGGTVGVPRTLEQIEANPLNGNIFGAGKGDPRSYFNEFTNVGSTEVEVTGGIVYGSVYGGGEDGHVFGNAETTIKKETGEGKVAPVIGCVSTSDSNGNVFGGGQGAFTALTAGVVGGNIILNILDGSINGSVYGGGEMASVGTDFDVKSENYGIMQDGTNHGCITVHLKGGTIRQNVYGGCMGATENDDLGVSKDVLVELNNGVDDAAKGCVVKGSIFGCNNVNSSPEGTSTVHIYKTQRDGASRITNTAEVTNAKVQGTKDGNGEYVLTTFDVPAVYGGGNLAAYTPKNANSCTNVIIDGCSRTSIGQVYGGGNAASTPATSVTVNGTFEIGELFGGGNGKDKLPSGADNPGANVGFKDYSAVENDERWNTKEKRETNQDFIDNYVYGTGLANVIVKGGTIHRVFGGSNTKGNVRETALTMLEEVSEGGLPVCEFHVDEAYGGGKSAPMDAEAKLLMACIPGLEEVYGGAQAADIRDDVTLTITNGTFNRVFGGNNISGTISGAITVNIEEVGCRPIIIGELYGGGNLAAYSIYGYNDDETPKTSGENPSKDPEVNVKSFTSIGSIYGGGFGAGALMVGSPTVNINEVADPTSDAQNKSYQVPDPDDPDDPNKATTKYYSDYAGETKTIAGHEVILPSHVKGKIGAIHRVFGGGNAAKVQGNTTVNIGTVVGDDIYLAVPVATGTNLTGGGYYTRSGTGTENYEYSSASGTAAADTTYYKKYTVLGVDIRNNVYGGGNNAEVTGNANVNIGKKETTP
jgi:hypothetical protein